MTTATGGAVAATTTEPRRKPSSFGVFAGSLAAFFALLAFLAVQVRAGGDPALGPAKPAATAEPRRVIVHRVIVRRVIVTERAPAASSPPIAERSSAPAPAPAAPAPAPAPAAPEWRSRSLRPRANGGPALPGGAEARRGGRRRDRLVVRMLPAPQRRRGTRRTGTSAIPGAS
jgi:hypothetical protein